MKNAKVLVAMLAAVGVLFTACQQDELNDPTTDELVSVSEDLGYAENLMDDALIQVEDALESEGINGKVEGEEDCECVVRTWSEAYGTFPNTLSIEFLADCNCGLRERTGQIIVSISDELTNEGASKTITLIDYTVDGILVEGTKTITNNGGGSFTTTVTGGQITYTDGSTASWERTRTKTRIGGSETPNFFRDDIYEITGNSSGISRLGVNYSTTITTPLVQNMNCKWIVSGIRSITRGENTATLNYGDGGCNRFAELSVNGNEPSAIILPR